jgi:pimeloyl-ACP methyl ester carboxylesterase
LTAFGDYHRGGDGPPLLLIHGVTATWRAWGPVIGLLEGQFEVLAPTLPGHSGGPDLPRSSTPVTAIANGLEAMLDEVGWERCHVAGFSLGGRLAFELAKRGRALDVTAIAPAGAERAPIEREWKRVERLFRRSHAGAVRFARLGARVASSPAARKVMMRDMMVDGSKLSADEARAMMAAFADTPVFADFFGEDTLDDHELREVDRIHVPVTVAWGENDRTLRQAKHEQFFRDNLPHARFVTIKKAGHVPFWDAPERIANAIAQTALSVEREKVQA